MPEPQLSDQFLASKSSSHTYADLKKFEDYLLNLLRNFELNQQPVAIWAASSDRAIFLIAACWNQNIPFVCLNPKAKNDTLKQQLQALNPALILTASSGISEEISGISVHILPELAKILNNKPSQKSQNLSPSEETIFGYFFTSGTSDEPKIVPLKRRQMFAAARASAQNIKPAPNHFWMLCMPLHHVGGVTLILRSLIYGSAIYRMEEFHVSKVSDLLQKNQWFAVASLVPTMLRRLLNNPDFKTHRNFKAVLLGGGPISPELLRECVHRQIPVIPSYGMTETCAQIAANPITKNQSAHHFESVGKIFKPNQVQIRTENNSVLGTGKSGSIWLKGPQIFDGYFGQSTGKNSIDENGWFNTGDFGRLDAQNNLYIEARRTDLIITGGENVSPFEVDAALESLPDVKEAAIFGAPDAEWGQRIVAVVVPKSGVSLSENTIKKSLRDKLPGFKIPKQFIFTDALPRTHTGKVQRAKLAKLL